MSNCEICNSDLMTGTHVLAKHRERLNAIDGDWKAALDRSMAAHPAGRALPPGSRDDAPPTLLPTARES